MKFKYQKSIFAALGLLAATLSVAVPLVFSQETEVDYPRIGDIEPPRTTRTFLPQYVRYIFYFALGIAGFIALAAFIYGGFRYLTSLGNPAALSDAKDQILASFLGIILLLGSWILLNSLNPQLISLQVGRETTEKGVVLCASGSCSANPAGAGLIDGEDFIAAKTSLSCLTNCPREGPSGGFNVGSIFFFEGSDALQVLLYSDKDYKNRVWNSDDFAPIGPNDVRGVGMTVNSVELIFKKAGVYLFSEEDCKGEARLYLSSTEHVGSEFDNKAKSIKIVPVVRRYEIPEGVVPPPFVPISGVVVQSKLGAILHENPKYKGDAMVWTGGDIIRSPLAQCFSLTGDDVRPCSTHGDQEPYCVESVRNRTSSVVVFSQRMPGEGSSVQPGDGVTLFANNQYNRQDPGDIKDENKHCGPINELTGTVNRLGLGKPEWVDGSRNYGSGAITTGTDKDGNPIVSEEDCGYLFGTGGRSPQSSSIEIHGAYLAVLFWADGRGEVFAESDIRLKDNHIGDDEARAMLIIPISRQ